MISKINLELHHKPELRKALFNHPKLRTTCRTERKIIKLLEPSLQELENPTKSSLPSQKFIEIRKIICQNFQTRILKPQKFQPSIGPLTNPYPPLLRQTIRSERASFSSSNPIKKHNPSTQLLQEEIESIPLSEAKTYYNERIYWKKRKKGPLPLCIINFNGILGDNSKTSFWDTSSDKLNLVDSVRSGLKLLSDDFYIIIVSWFSREITKLLLKTFADNTIITDAIYLVRHRKQKYRFRHNYTQIYEDFKVQNVSSSVVVITPVVLTREELAERKGLDIFYESSLSGCNKYCTIGLPIACSYDKEVPFCVLVPHCRLNDEHISFLELVKMVLRIKKLSCGDFTKAQCDGEVKLPCEHQEIPLIPLHPKEIGGYPIRYVVFIQFKPKKCRLPMSRNMTRVYGLDNK
ncbi:hypothetical protein SteCoe_440 [Stentor coeruleus]|uniref:Uncharacterized protein n=1 Tax=Stentor coeruleus TaxID=5963 RepID=A0A1R2D468_9CILI|nr:hypothetical protein SteCoe_440 [Stentor coeruleus]